MSHSTPKWIPTLPKVELHRHLELSIRASTLKELAPLHDIYLNNEEDFRRRFIIDQPMQDLGSVLSKFLDTQKLLSTTEILERIAYEACVDAASEGIRVLELRYAPTFVCDQHPELTFESAHLAIVKGVQRAEAELPIIVGLICIIQRILPVKEAERVTDFAIDHRDTFVALDLADNEVGFDSKPFASFFKRAKNSGLKITVHSGEAAVPKAPRYVLDAIEYLDADRIGHGVQVYRDLDVQKILIDRKIPLELCITSNYLTQAIPRFTDHPLKKLKDAGVLVTINTDDPGIFATNMNQEYALLHQHVGMTEADFIECNRIAFQHSFIPRSRLARVTEFLPPER